MKDWLGRFKAIILLGLLTVVLAGCGKENLTALAPKGGTADSSFYLIILTTIVMTLVFISVVIPFIIVLFKFRKKKGDPDIIPEQVEGNQKLETIWTIIPIVLVVIMAVPTILATFELADDADASEHINIHVTGNQYWWHFDYENEGIETSQDMYIPVNTKVYVHLITSDVLHSFWVPTLAGKLDVNPENVNTMYLDAREEGVYFGKCAELCGPSHSLMDFKVVVVSEDNYEKWVEDMKSYDSEKIELDAVAQEGKDLFDDKNCLSCHATDNQNYVEFSEDKPFQIAPNLTNFADRSRFAGILLPTKENLVEWLHDPEKIKPGNKMTSVYMEGDKYVKMPEEEAEKIAEYLMQLSPSDVTAESVDTEVLD